MESSDPRYQDYLNARADHARACWYMVHASRDWSPIEMVRLFARRAESEYATLALMGEAACVQATHDVLLDQYARLAEAHALEAPAPDALVDAVRMAPEPKDQPPY